MVKILNEAQCGSINPLTHMRLQYTFDRLRVDRSESSFGGRPALTRKEIAKGNKLVEKALQVIAW